MLTPASDEARPEAPPVRNAVVAAAYEANYKLLRATARHLKVPSHDVANVIHDVFVAFMNHPRAIDATADHQRAWLVSACWNVCRHYHRRSHRSEPFSPDFDPSEKAKLADRAVARMTAEDVLRALSPECRETLLQRFAEEYSPLEIADLRSIKYGSAKNKISDCLRRAREQFRKLMGRQL